MTARATLRSCSCFGERAFARRLISSAGCGRLRCAPMPSLGSAVTGVFGCQAERGEASDVCGIIGTPSGSARLPPSGSLSLLRASCPPPLRGPLRGSRRSCGAVRRQRKGPKKGGPPHGALGPLARRVRATPASAATVHPCTGAAGARSLAPLLRTFRPAPHRREGCAGAVRERPAMEGRAGDAVPGMDGSDTDLLIFRTRGRALGFGLWLFTPFGAADTGGISPQGERKG